MIGGDIFDNKQFLVPESEGRVWYECDLEYKGEERTAVRLLFYNDGLIYYTDNHYITAVQIY